MAASIEEKYVQNSKTIENLAIFKGLQQCVHLGISHLILEFECHMVVNEILGLEASHSLLGNLLFDIKALMATFQQCKMQFNPWECNSVI